MIGSNFPLASEGISRVGWIKSDGQSFIDLQRVLQFSLYGDYNGMKFELDAIWPTYPNTNPAPGTILGAQDGANVIELDTQTTATRLKKADHGTVTGRDWDEYDVQRNYTVEWRRNDHGAFVSGKLTWDNGTTIEPVVSDINFWKNGYFWYDVWDDSRGEYVKYYIRPTYPAQEETDVTEQSGPVIRWRFGGLTFTDAYHSGVFPTDAVFPYTGYPRRVKFDGIGEAIYIPAWPWTEGANGLYQLYDRSYAACALPPNDEALHYTTPPNASLFLFARNNALAAENIDQTTKVRRLKLFDGRDNCISDLVAARKSGRGAGLYDIINCKFYPNSGGGSILSGD